MKAAALNLTKKRVAITLTAHQNETTKMKLNIMSCCKEIDMPQAETNSWL